MLELHRLAHDAFSTHSQFLLDGTRLCDAVERAPTGGHPRVPAGAYPLILRPIGGSRFDTVKRFPQKFAPWYRGMVEVSRVPGRSAILIHPANWAHELLGCVAPAQSAWDDPMQGWTGSHSTDAWMALYRNYLYPALDAGITLLTVKDYDA